VEKVKPSSRQMPREVCLPICRGLFPKCTTHEGNFYAQYQKYFRNQAQEIYLIKEMFFVSKKQTQLLHNLLRVYKRSSTPFQQLWNCWNNSRPISLLQLID